MGNANTTPVDSYLDRHACSGRNITWHYMNNSGMLPAPYNACPYADEILSLNCCSEGQCHPRWPSEMERYEYDDWDGLGNPHSFIGDKDIWDRKKGPKSGSREKKSCGNRSLALMRAKEHWPPLGLDGQPVKDFKLYKIRERDPPYVQIDLMPSVEPIVRRDIVDVGVAKRPNGLGAQTEDGEENLHRLGSNTGSLHQTSALKKSSDQVAKLKDEPKKFIA